MKYFFTILAMVGLSAGLPVAALETPAFVTGSSTPLQH